MGSDGLLDNAFMDQIAEVVRRMQRGGADAEATAAALGELASRQANDPDWESPYTQEALQEGIDLPIWDKVGPGVGWGGGWGCGRGWEGWVGLRGGAGRGGDPGRLGGAGWARGGETGPGAGYATAAEVLGSYRGWLPFEPALPAAQLARPSQCVGSPATPWLRSCWVPPSRMASCSWPSSVVASWTTSRC